MRLVGRIDPAKAVVLSVALALHLWVFFTLPPWLLSDSIWYLAATRIVNGPQAFYAAAGAESGPAGADDVVGQASYYCGGDETASVRRWH